MKIEKKAWIVVSSDGWLKGKTKGAGKDPTEICNFNIKRHLFYTKGDAQGACDGAAWCLDKVIETFPNHKRWYDDYLAAGTWFVQEVNITIEPVQTPRC